MSANLSISVVLYKTNLDTLNDMFLSVNNSNLAGLSVNFFLIDNSCSKKYHYQLEVLIDSLELHDSINLKILRPKKNLGYGGGNNLIIGEQGVCDIHIVMNPDVVIEKNTFLDTFNFFSNNDNVGLLSPKIIMPDGEVFNNIKSNPHLLTMFFRSFAFFHFFPSIEKYIQKKSYLTQNLENEIFNVEYFSGAFLAFRYAIFVKISGFDERFFLHYEDADLTRRFAQETLTAYVPSIEIKHKWERDTHKSFKFWLITAISGFKYLTKWKLNKDY